MPDDKPPLPQPTITPAVVAAASAPLRRSGAGLALCLALALLLPLLANLATARSIVAIWNRSDTFAHGYLILPGALWLIWQQRAALARLPLRPCWPALPLLLGCAAAWLLAQLGEVQIVRQYAVVAMLPLAVLLLLGRRVARAIAFPLLFLGFAVPFGDVFIPPLMDVTADATIAALRLSGIPVLREGNTFMIPSGSWSVVEACSGLRYLISSLTLGCLYAWLTYRSRLRQAAFIALAVLVPIGANAVRAYGIVMMGHLSGMTMAVGFDHLIYGWVFFGLVISLLFLIGSLWREDRSQPVLDADARARAAATAATPSAAPGQLALAALAVLLAAGAGPLAAGYLERAQFNPQPVRLDGFQAGWPAATPFADWQPAFAAPAAQLRQSYAAGQQQVGLTLLYYRNQQAERPMISSGNRLTLDAKNQAWHEAGSALRQENLAGRALSVNETVLKGANGRLLVWRWYAIDGRRTANDYVGKLWAVRQRLLRGSDDGAVVLLYTPLDEQPEVARATLRRFLAANLAALDATLASNARP